TDGPRAIEPEQAIGIWDSGDSRMSYKHCADGRTDHTAPDDHPEQQCDRPRLPSSRGAARSTSKRLFADDSLRRRSGRHPPLRTAGDPFCGALGVAGYSGPLLNASQRLVQIERALGRADLGSGKAQIVGRGSEAAMTKKNLNGTHVSTGFQQVNGERRVVGYEA